jgi:prepilin-type N-terminal cleavage/methylation domain-containing protein
MTKSERNKKPVNLRKPGYFLGYSLLEVLVVLAIVSIIMVMMTNILTMTLEISRKSFARSITREQQTNILTHIEKDIRNSRYIGNCQGVDAAVSCEVALDKVYTWTTCERGEGFYVCKKDSEGNIVEGLSDDVIVNKFTMEPGLSDALGRKSILITLVVSYHDPEMEVENQVRQIIVSTRNYTN